MHGLYIQSGLIKYIKEEGYQESSRERHTQIYYNDRKILRRVYKVNYIKNDNLRYKYTAVPLRRKDMCPFYHLLRIDDGVYFSDGFLH
jgi:hypothetical protein